MSTTNSAPSSEPTKTVPKKRFSVPHTYAILFIIIVIAAVASYIIPTGEFDRVKDEASGKTIVVSGSYHPVESIPVRLFDMFKAIPEGMQKGAEIIFYIFLISGVFGIIRETGAIEAGIQKGATMLGLGCNLKPGLHNPHMSFDREALLDGIEILTRAVLTTFEQHGRPIPYR